MCHWVQVYTNPPIIGGCVPCVSEAMAWAVLGVLLPVYLIMRAKVLILQEVRGGTPSVINPSKANGSIPCVTQYGEQGT